MTSVSQKRWLHVSWRPPRWARPFVMAAFLANRLGLPVSLDWVAEVIVAGGRFEHREGPAPASPA